MLDAVFQFFLGDPPDPYLEETLYSIYYVARLIVGILFLCLILDVFRMARKLFF